MRKNFLGGMQLNVRSKKLCSPARQKGLITRLVLIKSASLFRWGHGVGSKTAIAIANRICHSSGGEEL